MRSNLGIEIWDDRWFAFTSFAFLFRKKKYVKEKKQFVQDLIPPLNIYIVKWRLLLLLLVKKWCSSFVWNSQGAFFYAHRSERLWFADCRTSRHALDGRYMSKGLLAQTSWLFRLHRGIVAFNFSPRNLTQVTSTMKPGQEFMIWVCFGKENNSSRRVILKIELE